MTRLEGTSRCRRESSEEILSRLVLSFRPRAVVYVVVARKIGNMCVMLQLDVKGRNGKKASPRKEIGEI